MKTQMIWKLNAFEFLLALMALERGCARPGDLEKSGAVATPCRLMPCTSRLDLVGFLAPGMSSPWASGR